jgi:1-acyl-sn-glycerol-3-phosphate acyltransferase
LPFWLPVAALADLVSGLRRFPTVRLFGFVGVYLVHSWIAVLAAFGLWLTSGLGRKAEPGNSRKAELEPYRRMQAWWAQSLLVWAGRLLGVRVDWPDLSDLPSGRFIVLSRHASMVDAVLPAVLVTSKLGRFVHYVLKAELRWDPSLDLYGTKLGNHFVTRTGSQTENEPAAIETLAGKAQPGAGIIIFPEGTYASPTTRMRVLGSLERTAARNDADDDDRLVLDLAQRLRFLLPPKPAGTLALFDGAPDADVVVLGHLGLEGVAHLRGLRHRLPLNEPIRLRWWVHPRDQVPNDPDGQVAWLNARWLELDGWVADQQRTDGHRGAVGS